MIFENHANLKYNYGQKTFWARGYYVSTVGLNKQIIAKYIREQETEDMIQDKLSECERRLLDKKGTHVSAACNIPL